MKKSEFDKMPEKKPDNPVVGDIFLEGTKMVGQKGNKKPGQLVTLYKVIRVVGDGSTIEYIPVYEKLEADEEEKPKGG
jgi:hypothetical protein